MPLSDRAKAGLTAFIRQVVGLFLLGPRMDYLGSFKCKVISQNADGSLELMPDDTRLPPFSKVPIRWGIPGSNATINAGARVYLEFASADPQQPFVGGFDLTSGALIVLNLGGTSGMQGVGLGANIRTELDAIWAAIYGGHTHILTIAGASGSGATGTAAPAAGSSSTQTVSSSIVKVKP